jgi:hypothetical protein
LPRLVGTALSARGIDVLDARDIGLYGADDPQVFAHAQNDVRTIVTRDVDFADIVAYPLGTHHGIVVARVPSKRSLAVLADAFARPLTGSSRTTCMGHSSLSTSIACAYVVRPLPERISKFVIPGAGAGFNHRAARSREANFENPRTGRAFLT